MGGHPVSVAQPSRPAARVNILSHHTIGRYLFAVATVAGTFALRTWLIPFSGTSALLFFAAVMVTSLFAGVGPGICALLISLPLAAYAFVTRAGYPHFQAAYQTLLFAIDGVVVIYLTYLMKKGRQAAKTPTGNCCANEEITRSMARTREIIELSPDAFFQADLDARFTDVNQAAWALRLRSGRVRWQNSLRYYSSRGRTPAEGGPGRTSCAGTNEHSRVDPKAEGWKIRAGRVEFEHPVRRPLAGVRARHQRAQAHRTGATGIGGTISAHHR
jgi:hypothetical protein